MTPTTEFEPSLEKRVTAALATVPEWRDLSLRWRPAAAPLVSPTHRAVASDCVVVEGLVGGPVFLKIRHADMVDDVLPEAGAAARRAADLELGPAVILDRPGLLGLAFLPEPWRYARVGDLQDADLLGQVVDAKKRLHGAPLLGRRFSPFERIAALAAEAASLDVPLPDGTERLVGVARLVEAAIEAAGVDLRFCHDDGMASNVMIGGDGIRLVDFDLAADNDPWFDVGALMNEACNFDAERRAIVERYAGTFDERLYHRSRLYGAIDDLMWGLWGITRAITSPRTGIEFWKYGTWRLFHAGVTFGARDFELWLRRL